MVRFPTLDREGRFARSTLRAALLATRPLSDPRRRSGTVTAGRPRQTAQRSLLSRGVHNRLEAASCVARQLRRGNPLRRGARPASVPARVDAAETTATSGRSPWLDQETRPQSRALTQTDRPVVFGFLQCSLRLRVKKRGVIGESNRLHDLSLYPLHFDGAATLCTTIAIVPPCSPARGDVRVQSEEVRRVVSILQRGQPLEPLPVCGVDARPTLIRQEVHVHTCAEWS